ncbi:MAG TPA: hypothetical protein VMH40_17120 [Myxococcaceae bacterium]|nr:hypothetical protein [Myxococcaceae bacterium]
MNRSVAADSPDRLVRVVDGALPPELFRTLREKVVTLGTRGIRRTYQTTFWLDLDARPAALPELGIVALARRFREAGARGVEWWLSRMWTGDVQVDFHRDRDEKLALRGGPERHPRVSSVLFLNRVRGGALVVTAQRPDPRNPAMVPLPLEADLVGPRPNRLVVFDGKLTHGVLDAENQVPTGRLRKRGELRLTVVMNGWTRRPRDVPRFEGAGVYPGLRIGSRR